MPRRYRVCPNVIESYTDSSIMTVGQGAVMASIMAGCARLAATAYQDYHMNYDPHRVEGPHIVPGLPHVGTLEARTRSFVPGAHNHDDTPHGANQDARPNPTTHAFGLAWFGCASPSSLWYSVTPSPGHGVMEPSRHRAFCTDPAVAQRQ